MAASAGERTGTGSGGPVRRVLIAELDRLRASTPNRVPRVLDVGGGSGGWAVPLAVSCGCAVTVVDTSPDALATLRRRAREAGVADLVTAVQGDVDALADVVTPGGADLVLGHGLLEVVDDAAAAVAALSAAAAPGAAVSVLVAGRYAAVLVRILAGRLDEARAVLTDPDGRAGPADGLRRRLDVASLTELLERDGTLRVELVQGDGVFDNFLPSAVYDSGPAAARAAAELTDLAAGVSALRDIAVRLHAVARRVA